MESVKALVSNERSSDTMGSQSFAHALMNIPTPI